MTLTDEEIRIKVAESRGWTREPTDIQGLYGWISPQGGFAGRYHHPEMPEPYEGDPSVPNYPKDLNACAEFEATLTDEEQQEYFYQLNEEVGLVSPRSPAWLLEWSVFKLVTATARQRCLAFLKTKGILP